MMKTFTGSHAWRAKQIYVCVGVASLDECHKGEALWGQRRSRERERGCGGYARVKVARTVEVPVITGVSSVGAHDTSSSDGMWALSFLARL